MYIQDTIYNVSTNYIPVFLIEYSGHIVQARDLVGCVCLRTLHTSSTLNSVSNSSFIFEITGVVIALILTLKLVRWWDLKKAVEYCRIMPSILSWSSCHTLFEFCMPTILFFLCLWLAVAWKNFVFRSPHLIQSALDLWFHIISSLVKNSLISVFNSSCQKSPQLSYIYQKAKKMWHFILQCPSRASTFSLKKCESGLGLSEPDRPIRLFWKVALFARHSPEIINPPQNPIIFDLSRHYSLPLSLSQFEFRSLIQYFPLFWNSGKTVQLHSCSQFQNPRKIFSTPKTISSTPTSASIRF